MFYRHVTIATLFTLFYTLFCRYFQEIYANFKSKMANFLDEKDEPLLNNC